MEPIPINEREPHGSDFVVVKASGSTLRYCWLGYKRKFPRTDSKRMRWQWYFTIYFDKNQRDSDFRKLTHWLPANIEHLPALVKDNNQKND